MEKIKAMSTKYKTDGKVVSIIKKGKSMGLSFGAIAHELNQNGFRSPRGKKFHRTTVKRLYEEAENKG